MWPIMGMTRGMLLLLLFLMQTSTGWAGGPKIILTARPPARPTVRLVNTHSRCIGRVEILHNKTWGTVCDDFWDLNDAQVVCRQLGCGKALLAPSSAFFGRGSGQIWLDDVQCRGNESSLAACAHRGFGTHNCFHGEDASVICEEIPTVRLVNSNNSCSGRVETLQQGIWGTVCDDSWDLNDAHVVCRQVGCGKALAAPHNASFGQGTGPIWLDDLQCSGNETSLTDCAHRGLGNHSCRHSDDASAICEGILPIRLVNSNNSCSGRVEILRHGIWGTVCDDSWNINDAHVVCRQVGCGKALAAPQRARFGQGTGPIWLDNIRCRGNETSLTDCQHNGLSTHNCRHSEDASVICTGIPTTTPTTTTPTTTTPTTTGQPLLLDSQLVCSPDQIEVGVPLHSLLSAGLNASSGHLASPYCSSHIVRGSIIWYKVQRRTGICGTVMTTNTTHAIYCNSLFFYPLSNGSFVLPSIIPFSCAYPLETHTSLNAAIKLQLQKGGLVGSGTKAKSYMNLYRDSNFSYIYPAGQLTLSVGSMLHVQVSVNVSDPSFAVVVEECYTTNSSNPDDPIRYFLIHSRCPTDSRRVSVVENGMSLRARFSALLFPLHVGNPCVFIHCRLHLCDKRTQNCVPTCRRRITRSVDTNSETLLSVGPIDLV